MAMMEDKVIQNKKKQIGKSMDIATCYIMKEKKRRGKHGVIRGSMRNSLNANIVSELVKGL